MEERAERILVRAWQRCHKTAYLNLLVLLCLFHRQFTYVLKRLNTLRRPRGNPSWWFRDTRSQW
jgi:hypothetical protein